MTEVAKRKDIDPTFGRRLRELREAVGVTLVELGRRAGMLPHAIGRLEYGQREPGWQTVQRLATALGVSVADFVVASSDTPTTAVPPPEPPRPAGKHK